MAELRCTFDPDTRSGADTSGKKVKGVIQWVSVSHGEKVTVRLYDKLFMKENPEDEGEGEGDFTANINPESLVVLKEVPVEPAAVRAPAGSRFQFLRKGYFYLDPQADQSDRPVYNRIVSLKDSWSKQRGQA